MFIHVIGTPPSSDRPARSYSSRERAWVARKRSSSRAWSSARRRRPRAPAGGLMRAIVPRRELRPRLALGLVRRRQRRLAAGGRGADEASDPLDAVVLDVLAGQELPGEPPGAGRHDLDVRLPVA